MRFISQLILLSLCGCSLLRERPADEPSVLATSSQQIGPDQAQEVMESAASNWFFGQGVGETALNAGAVLAFPPYIAVVLGNAALSLSGYEPITVSGLLPEEQGEVWSDTYDAVASSPGRLSAAVAGKEFRTKDVIKDDMKKLLQPESQTATDAETQAGPVVEIKANE